MRSLYLSVFAPMLAASCLAATPPNIVVFFSDDHARQAISAYQQLPDAAPQIKLFENWAPLQTPNIDRLADQGVIFANGYVSNSICRPSRANLLTGLHSHANGMLDNLTSSADFDGRQQTFPKLLQASGYHTALIGKWHLGSEPTGFDYYERLVNQGAYYDPLLRTTLPGDLTNITYTGEYVADVLTERATTWLQGRLDANRTDPFFLMVNHKGPHRNWEPSPQETDPAVFRAVEWDYTVTPNPDTNPAQPELWTPKAVPIPASFTDYVADYVSRSDAARMQDLQINETMRLDTDIKLEGTTFGGTAYDEVRSWWAANSPGMTDVEKHGHMLRRYLNDYALTVRSVDRSIGEILDFLEANNLDHNTIILYSSDQGFFLGEHGWYDKRWIYEESLWTPLLMQWRDANGNSLLSAGAVIEEPVQVIDYAPTLLDAAQVTPDSPMHGESFLGLATLASGDEPADWRHSIYYHYIQSDGGVGILAHYGVRDDRYKLIHHYEIGKWELFDLQEDPYETNNLFYDAETGLILNPTVQISGSPEFRQRVRALMQELRALRSQYGDGLGGGFMIPGVDDVDEAILLNLNAALAAYDGGRTPSNSPKVTAPNLGAGFAFHLELSPHALDMSGTVLLMEVGGTANGSGLYLINGLPTFITKQDSGNADQPDSLDDRVLDQVAVQSTYGVLTAAETYRIALIYRPPTLGTVAELEFAVQPVGGAITIDAIDLSNARRRGDWSGNESLSVGTPHAISSSAGGLSETGGDGTVFDRSNVAGFNGTLVRALYWNAPADPVSHVATLPVVWNSGRFDVPIQQLFKGASYRLYRDTSLSFSGGEVEVDALVAGDAVETLSDASPPSGKAFYRVVEER